MAVENPKELTLQVFTRWSSADYFSPRAAIEVPAAHKTGDIEDLILKRIPDLPHGVTVLAQWQDSGKNILTFRVTHTLERVKL